MPKCSYCNKIFNDRQALGNHIKTHLDDSDDEDSQDLINMTFQNLNQNEFKEADVICKRALSDDVLSKETDMMCKRVHIEQKSNDNQQERINEFVVNSPGEFIEDSSDGFIEDSSDGFIEDSSDGFIEDSSDDEHDEHVANSSDEESVTSDLSYITNVDANKYTKYNALFNGVPSNPEDIRQEFPSEEYAEFMYIITRFHVQDSLANMFIQFFNKYSNRDDKPLPSTSQNGRTFMENLQLPNFGWREESIFKYKEKEYIFEYRTILDGIHQILMNKDVTKDFIFKYKSSDENVSILIY
jgi:hypothetical protein